MKLNSFEETRKKRYHEVNEKYGGNLPSWFLILSHHYCDELDHCLRVQIGAHRPIFICARCFGAYLGFIIGFLFLYSEIVLQTN